ncbi:hypothetical protein TPHA_0F02550 [Tetrapisispora phaffii CBS 4417]|uniref:Zn(2)-C6 fungal-type domain-containing protein n=1 Tax=Tetrapisispora phaffii (strain ATCC 24235 / CBS 4417 / NBRC 1672 / NRRL Y-8282 / UCD 70-5) TaxID=1071381 RepID=G8BUF0_TETPH|nr:hypothetical protein TPHA_0F02550 [Tetrapisispora phaffii CBS 4417]CCE63736.1 hypothetical protein TPHA_0F02550 [Tetrapisispora phaffii CBS 4417]
MIGASPSPSNGTNQGVKKKRNKLIKSCTFCRMRKLKCDKNKPMCSTCVVRQRKECSYTYTTSSRASSPTANDGKVNISNLSKKENVYDSLSPSEGNIEMLKDTVNTNGYLADSPSVSNTKYKKNPYYDYYNFQMKESGKISVSGPTSIRTTLIENSTLFRSNKLFNYIWEKVKISRDRWKLEHNFEKLNELSFEEQATFSKSKSLLYHITLNLPPYKEIVESINDFFDKSDIYYHSMALDKNKILSDLKACFILDNFNEKVIQIILINKFNHFKVAVILEILCITHFGLEVPHTIQIYRTHVKGITTSKSMYVEKAQFLLLHVFYLKTYCLTSGDYTNLLTISDLLCSTCIGLGFNRNIDALYSNKETLCGSLKSIKHIWLFTLFLDWDVSFNTGKGLAISKNDYDLDDFLKLYASEVEYTSITALILRFLKIIRKQYIIFTDRNETPDLSQFVEEIISFLKLEFPDIKNYVNYDQMHNISLMKFIVLIPALSVIITFLGLNKNPHQSVTKVRNYTYKFDMMIFKLTTNLVKYCFLLDNEYYPEIIRNTALDSDGYSRLNISPHLSFSISLTNSATLRSQSHFFFVAYLQLTYFSNNLVLSSDLGTAPFDIQSFCTPNDENYNMDSVFDFYVNVSIEWWEPQVTAMTNVLLRSYSCVIMKTLHKICFTIISTMRSIRDKTEHQWAANNECLVNAGNVLQKEIDCQINKSSNEIKVGKERSLYISPQGYTSSIEESMEDIKNPNFQYLDHLRRILDFDNCSLGSPTTKEESERYSKEFWANYVLDWEQEIAKIDNIFEAV